MLEINTIDFNAPIRTITAKVELFSDGSTDAITIPNYGDLQSITIDRAGENKFFGFGICTRANIKLLDINRTYNLTTSNSFKIYFDNVCAFPQLYITEVHRDEKTNTLSITMYDTIYKAKQYTVADLELTTPYTIQEFVEKCGELLGVEVVIQDVDHFQLRYFEGANFDGKETIREALNAAAEATQTIYFMDANNRLVFKQLRTEAPTQLIIDRSSYIELKEGDNRRLAAICSATELGDDIIASMPYSGTTQYIRNNPFLDLREDRATVLEQSLADIGGMTVAQFDCKWRGNYLLEIGDKIGLVNKDNSISYSYFLNDQITYQGSYIQNTSWTYEEGDESAANPTNIGEALHQTFAKVDKVNKTVDIVVSEVDNVESQMSAIQMATDNISMSVQNVEAMLDDTNNSIGALSSRVDMAMTADDVKIEIQNGIADGINEITTTTGFTFNDEGLTVSKTGSEMTTQITENGMTVSRNNSVVLTADNVGVQATNLHATTYLIIGTNSRIEDYGSNRTGCFWIGG